LRSFPGTPIKVEIDSDAIAIIPNGKTAYVVNQYRGTATPIRIATNTALAPVKVGRGPLLSRSRPDDTQERERGHERTAAGDANGSSPGPGRQSPADERGG
jgi:hypothetical protein